MTSMERSAAGTILGAVVAAACLLAGSVSAKAQTTSAPATSQTPSIAVTQLYNTENAAVASRDYAKFIAPGTATFKKSLTKDLFTGACANISDNLKTGYTSQFVAMKPVQASTAYVWTLTCKNGVQYRTIMAVSAGKVAAFLYQPPPPAAK